jgi:ubiquinone biosynthesis protein
VTKLSEHVSLGASAGAFLTNRFSQHCDPHPGNILLADDGRLALMDFGMVGRFDAGQKDSMILLLLAFSERLGERVAETYLEMINEIPDDLDVRGFTQDICGLVSRHHDMSGGRMGLGSALDLTRLAYTHLGGCLRGSLTSSTCSRTPRGGPTPSWTRWPTTASPFGSK